LAATLRDARRRPEDLPWFPADWRLAVFFLLRAQLVCNTFDARVYFSAWERFYEDSKVFPPLPLMLALDACSVLGPG
jgi:hypothetical protein